MKPGNKFGFYKTRAHLGHFTFHSGLHSALSAALNNNPVTLWIFFVFLLNWKKNHQTDWPASELHLPRTTGWAPALSSLLWDALWWMKKGVYSCQFLTHRVTVGLWRTSDATGTHVTSDHSRRRVAQWTPVPLSDISAVPVRKALVTLTCGHVSVYVWRWSYKDKKHVCHMKLSCSSALSFSLSWEGCMEKVENSGSFWRRLN